MGHQVKDLVVIGAMKSGTTSLFHDLITHPDVVSFEKESGLLYRPEVWKRRAPSPSDRQVRLDVSASYSMEPYFSGAAASAGRLLTDVHVVYLVRDPVDRLLSHHHHDVASGVAPADVNEALERDGRFLAYSRYWTQLQPWRHVVSDDRVRVVKFEDYVTDRVGVVLALHEWVGLPAPANRVELRSIHNDSRERRASRGLLRRVLQSDLYRDRLHGLVSDRLRNRASQRLLPPPAPRPAPPDLETLASLVRELKPEMEHLRGYTSGRVHWDLDGHVHRTPYDPSAG